MQELHELRCVGHVRAGPPTEVIRTVLPCVRGSGRDLEWCTELRTLLTGELRALDERIDELQRRRGALVGYPTRP